ncbi:MAG: hypothetical protein SWE60_03645, partial [Thermodesulfobacteriota bacterium]|nr:hypothetical protein [Thermodesulfobacteriota bacterium]
VIEKRFRDTFSKTACIRTSDGFNVVLFGRVSGNVPKPATLVTAARKLTAEAGLSFDLGKAAKALRTECVKP